MNLNKLIQPANNFLKNLSGDVLIVHGHDCDSMCSAAIFYKLIKRISKINIENLVTTINFSINDTDFKKIVKKHAKNIVMLDIPEIGVEYIVKIAKNSKVLIVDHHKPKGYVRISYVNPMVYESVYIPTTYICYKIFESFFKADEVLWLACLGTLGDHGVENCQDIFKKLMRIHPELIGKTKLTSNDLFNNSELGLMAKMIDATRIANIKYIPKTYEILANAKNYKDVKENFWLKKVSSMVEKEFEIIKKDFEKNKKFFGKIVFYEIKSKMNLKSSFAGYLSGIMEDEIICVAQRFGDVYDVSFRRGKNLVDDLSELASKLSEGIGYGGGHAAAAAVRGPVKKFNEFIKRLKSAY